MSFEIAAIVAFGFYVGYTMAAGRPDVKPPAIDEFTATTASQSRPIPVLFGTRLIKSANVVWYGDVRTTAVYSEGGAKK